MTTTDLVLHDDVPLMILPPAEDRRGGARSRGAQGELFDASEAPHVNAGSPEMPQTDEVRVRPTGEAWTIPMLCAGIALIAACVLVPLADENRQLVYERTKLELDLAQIKKQVSVNEEFLKKLGQDPTLAERLAQRQMKTIREGAQVVDLGGASAKAEMSPFMLVSLSPPAPLEPYSPVGGWLTHVCLRGKLRLFLVGAGLMLCAGGLVIEGVKKDEGVMG